MVKSTRSRRALKVLGSGASVTLFHAPVAGARRLVASPVWSREAKRRLKWFDGAHTHTISATCRPFDSARSVFYYGKARCRADALTRLEHRSSRPKRVRVRQWTAGQAEAVCQAREAHPRWGKAKLAMVLACAGIALCVSTIGRILRYLRQRGVLREPTRVGATPSSRHARSHAQRKPKGVQLLKEAPGDLVRIDTVHLHPLPGVTRGQFTAVDCYSRWGEAVRTRAMAGTAADLLADLLARFPFAVKAMQIDGGSEWMRVFEAACQGLHLPLWVLPPHRPKLNDQVERQNRTGREECWEWYAGELDLPVVGAALQAWEREYNTQRPHHALGLRTPADFLADYLSKTS